MQFFPWGVHARDAILSGRVPLWNSASAAGEPLLAVPHAQVLSPFSLLLYVLPFPASLTFIAVARLVVGGVGMFVYLRRLSLSVVGAAFGGFAYLLNPFSIVWLEHPQASVAAWLPWTLLAAESCAVRPTSRTAALVASVVALAFLSGHPETFQNIALLTAAYVMWRGFTAGHLVKSVAWVAVGAVLGLLIASVQLLPFVEYSRESHALALRASIGAPIAANPIASFVTTFVPDFYGNPTGRGYVLGFTNYFAQQVYPGVATWLFASVAVFDGRRRGLAVFFLASASVAAAIMYGTVVARAALFLFPPLRVTLLWGFGFLVIACLDIAAAFGVDLLVSSAHEQRSQRHILWAGVVSIAAFGISLIVWAFWREQHTLLFDSRQAVHTLRSMKWGAELLVATVLLTWMWRFIGPVVAGVIASGIIVVDLLVFASGFHALIPASLAFPALPELSDIQADKSIFRVGGWVDTLLPNTAMMYGLQDFRGYDAMGVGPYSQLLDAGFFFNGATHQLVNVSSAPMLDLLNVKYVLTPPDVELPADHFEKIVTGPTAIYRNRRTLDRAFLVNNTRVLQDREALKHLRAGDLDLRHQAVVEGPLDLASAPGGAADIAEDAVVIQRYEDQRVTMETSAAGSRLLVLLDADYPGWVATIDRIGVPIHRVDYAFRGVVVPAGRHIIEFQYRPWSVRAGATLSLVSLVPLIWLFRKTRPVSDSQSRRVRSASQAY